MTLLVFGLPAPVHLHVLWFVACRGILSMALGMAGLARRVLYARVCPGILKVFITRKPNMMWRYNLRQIDFSRRGAEGFGSSWQQTLGDQL